MVDSAILEALGLEKAEMKPVGSSGFSSTYKLSSSRDGQPVTYFVKTARGPSAEVMFRGEHASLNAIHRAVPDLCPQSHAHGRTSRSDTYFLATDFVHRLGAAPDPNTAPLADKLARLHGTPAPVPEGFDKPMFGFPVATCCGDTRQDNSWKARWVEFYAENRLRAITRLVEENQGADEDLRRAVHAVAERVLPRLLDGVHVVPVVVHGDLWSGNHSTGCLRSDDPVGDVVFDPSCVYGHSEYELGIMKMFGGFGASFWRRYEELVPRAEPKDEWADRVSLYELYHHLNHYAIFGRGYRQGAMSIMKKLLSKYDKG